MSEDSKPQQLPSTSSTPAEPSATNPATPGSTPATPVTPIAVEAPKPPPPPAPTPIDYAMGAPKKPFTLPRSTFLWIKMALGLCVLLGMGYFALVALNPKAREWATQGGADGSGGPTPFKALNQLLAIPARAVGKTKDVVAASDARTNMVNKVVAEEEKNQEGTKSSSRPLTDIFSKSSTPAEGGKAGGAAAGDKEAGDASISRERLLALAAQSSSEAVDTADRPVTARTAPAVPPPPPGPAEMKIGGGIVLTNRPAPDGNPASAPFMYWVAGLSIKGVMNSTPPRFLLNGKLVQEGEEVNKTLAIIFDHLDSATKAVYFRDKSGAMVSRSY